MKKIFLCDGHNLAFRAFYGIRELSRSDGFPTNMIHGWVRSFWRLEDDFSPDEIWVFFDRGGCPQRESILPEYKANRGSPPEGFSEQLEYVKQLTGAMGYGWGQKEGLEADDLIATKVCELEGQDSEVTIVSSDKDLAQLVSSNVKQLLPPPTANPRIGWRLLDQGAVAEKFGVSPAAILDYLAIIGDQSDNIPGLPGVGPKTAVKWIQEFGDMENLIANAGRLHPKRFCSIVYERREDLRRNLRLIKLISDVDYSPTAPSTVSLENLESIFAAMEMNKTWQEAQNRYSAS
ncbi:MAG: 5'-3' exonuclease H3TH domain-containing protein [Opitutae bacterium]